MMYSLLIDLLENIYFNHLRGLFKKTLKYLKFYGIDYNHLETGIQFFYAKLNHAKLDKNVFPTRLQTYL